ncbi:MAG: tRNA lysidine(34) synthetase TilS [Sphaerochaetaceae bacterium]|nr:tRNA lysidine(34) synthetase TilS [Sphaerochaetaceae bacterium]
MNLTERAFSDTVTLLTDFKKPLNLVVAFSGGCDSLALLILCVKTLGKEHVHPLYVNHRLRTDSELEGEITLNKENCRKLGLKLSVADLQKNTVSSLASRRKGGLEDAARSLRYAELEDFRLKTGSDFIATAHHKDDQIETVLMKIMRKAPLPSLRGISEKNGVIIRPLLDYSRDCLEDYVASQGFSWSTDSTNALPDYERNDIRLNVIPSLKTVMEDYGKRILSIRDRAVNLCMAMSGGSTGNVIEISSFNKMNDLQKTLELYRCWDHVFGYKSMPQTLCSRIIKTVSLGKSGRISANGAHVSITDSLIIISDASEDLLFNSFCKPLVPGEKTILPSGMICELSKSGSSTDIRLPSEGSFSVRFVKVGDDIILKEGRKTVLKLLQDMKIPSALRSRVPLICDSFGVCAVAAEIFGGRNRVALRYLNAEHTLYFKFGV